MCGAHDRAVATALTYLPAAALRAGEPTWRGRSAPTRRPAAAAHPADVELITAEYVNWFYLRQSLLLLAPK
jgi:hypothetical protein